MVWTDHQPLCQAFKNSESSKYDPIARNHLVEVSNWTQDIRHVAGRLNAVPDLLSRPPGVPLGTAHQLPEAGNPDPVDDVLGLPVFDDAEPAHVDAVALQTLDPRQIEDFQQHCLETKAHKEGKHPDSLNMQMVEFAPGVWLLCDIAKGKKARPLLPQAM